MRTDAPEPASGGGAGLDLDAGKQIKRVLKAALDHRFRIAILGSLGLILGGAVSTFVPDLYESQTTMLVRERALIDDSRLMKAIEDKPLDQKEQTLEAELLSFMWVRDVLEKCEWPEYAQIQHDPAKVREFVDRVRENKHYKVDLSTDAAGELLIKLSFAWHDAAKARDFVLWTRKNWITRRDEEDKKYHRQKLDEFNIVVGERQTTFSAAAASRQEFEALHGLLLEVQDNPELQHAGDLKTKITDLKGNIEQLEVQLRNTQELLDREPQTLKYPTEDRNPLFDAAQFALSEAQQLLAQLRERYSDSHPEVKKQKTKVEQAQKSLDALAGQEMLPTTTREEPNPTWSALSASKAQLEPELNGARQQLQSLEASYEEVSKRLESQPLLRAQHRRLVFDYESAAKALDEARIAITPLQDRVRKIDQRASTAVAFADSEAELGKSGAFEILEEPVAARTPIGLPKQVFGLIGLLVGLALGFATCFVGELARSNFVDVGEVQDMLRLPVLGAIHRIATTSELRRIRVRQMTQGAGAVLIVATLGAAVYVVTNHPERLPQKVQKAIEDLRATFQ